MQSALDCRQEMLDYLEVQHQGSIAELAQMYSVSKTTVRRNICILSRNHPLETKPGPHGGVFMKFEFLKHQCKQNHLPYLDSDEEALLLRLFHCVHGNDQLIIERILEKYATPMREKEQKSP